MRPAQPMPQRAADAIRRGADVGTVSRKRPRRFTVPTARARDSARRGGRDAASPVPHAGHIRRPADGLTEERQAAVTRQRRVPRAIGKDPPLFRMDSRGRQHA